jgi:hypothetical protein
MTMDDQTAASLLKVAFSCKRRPLTDDDKQGVDREPKAFE